MFESNFIQNSNLILQSYLKDKIRWFNYTCYRDGTDNLWDKYWYYQSSIFIVLSCPNKNIITISVINILLKIYFHIDGNVHWDHSISVTAGLHPEFFKEL